MSTKTIDLELCRRRPLCDFSAESGKATRGKLLVIGGSARLPGAILLCARAALRTGCGTVRVAAPQSIALAIGVACPELMVLPLPETAHGTIAPNALQVLVEQYEACDAAVIGPGLDENDETAQFAHDFAAQYPLPTLLDASAMLAASTCSQFPAPRIWTPHDGEMQTLLNREFDESERPKLARDWAKRTASTCALKGRETFIANTEGECFRNIRGTRGLGTAGSGDVLSGVIGSLLAQGNNATTATIYGVYLHALAGEDAARMIGADGLLASDFEARLPFALRELKRRRKRPKRRV